MDNLTIILSFKTEVRHNRLSEIELFEYVDALTTLAGGVTVTEQFGGYRMDNGNNSVEYSYKFELFGLDRSTTKTATDYFMKLKELNSQESIIVNGNFVY